MRIFCWNVNSLVPTVRNINLKYGSLEAFFKHLDADIVCMQEVKLPQQKLTKELVVVPGYQSYWACSEGKTGYSGVTTWAREACAAVSAEADSLLAEGCEREGRALITDHGPFVLFNVYVPNAGDRPARARLPAKLAFLQAQQERVDAVLGSGRQVIAVGDFNIAAEPRDVHSAISWDTLYADSELQALQQLIQTLGDSWRRLHPQQEGVYTVWDEKTSARAFNVGLRIDYALCSKQLLDHVQSCEVLLDMPPKWSDHAPLMLELQLPPAEAAAAAEPGQPQQQQQQQVCPMWRELLKRFADPSQRSIASMFKAAKPSSNKGAAAAAAAGASKLLVAESAALPGGKAAGAGSQMEAGAQQATAKRPLEAATASAAAHGPAAASSRDGSAAGCIAEDVGSRGVKSARMADSALTPQADMQRTGQQQQEPAQGASQQNLEQQWQQQQHITEFEQQQQQQQGQQGQQGQQQPAGCNPKAAAAAKGEELPGSRHAAGASRSADNEGRSALSKQAGKKSSSSSKKQQQQQQRRQQGPKQASLHAFLAKP